MRWDCNPAVTWLWLIGSNIRVLVSADTLMLLFLLSGNITELTPDFWTPHDTLLLGDGWYKHDISALSLSGLTILSGVIVKLFAIEIHN